MRRRTFLAGMAGLAGTAVTGLSACGSGGSGSANSGTLKVAYQKFGNATAADSLFTKMKTVFEQANPDFTVELIPIEACQNDYFTKLALMNRSPSTAPDLMYEDTYMIRSDVGAGYLMPLDDYLNGWPEWSEYIEVAKTGGRADDGKMYGIPLGTDTRGLWFNKQILQQAGLPGDWAPKNWDEILGAARAIKEKVPGVIPFNIYSGKPMGEGAVMQGFEMLLYGTKNTLYDDQAKKWVVGSQGFSDALDFLRTVYTEGLAPTPQQALDSNLSTRVTGELLPQGKLAIALDGSWLPSSWQPSGKAAWPAWESTMGTAAMPTQTGDSPGKVSMSGGWTLAMGANTKAPDAAFKFLSLCMNRENSLGFVIEDSQIAVRKDVAEDPAYLKSNPTTKFWTDLVPVTHYRPATADYPQISNAIMVAMEAVMTGQSDVASAAAAYDKAVTGIVGAEQTVKA